MIKQSIGEIDDQDNKEQEVDNISDSDSKNQKLTDSTKIKR